MSASNNVFNSNYPQLIPEFQSCRYHNHNNSNEGNDSINNNNNPNTNSINSFGVNSNPSNQNQNLNPMASSVGTYPQMSSSDSFANLVDYQPFNCNFTNSSVNNHTSMASTVQCPHNHGFYSATTSPINSPHLAYIPNIPSLPSIPSIAANIPPNGSNVSQYGQYFSPPPAHLPLHPYSIHPHSRLHPNQQRLWMAQQRMNEMQRQRQSLYQHQMFVRYDHFFKCRAKQVSIAKPMALFALQTTRGIPETPDGDVTDADASLHAGRPTAASAHSFDTGAFKYIRVHFGCNATEPNATP